MYVKIGGVAAKRVAPVSGRDRSHVLDGHLQRLEIDRLGEVGQEARLTAPADVFLHPVAAQRDAPGGKAVADLPHQVESTAVGEPDVADDQVEVSRGRD